MKKYYPLVTSIFVLIIYIFTFARSTVSLDNGELAATSYLLGIPHPPGYPLFTIIGYLFSHIPIPIRIIHKLNFLSAIYATISVYFIILLFRILLDEFERKSNNSGEKLLSTLPENLKIFVSIYSGLVFAFSKTLWFQSTNYEVYSLNIALISATMFYSVKAFMIESKSEEQSNISQSTWLIVFFLYGLILSNHLFGGLVIFPILYFYFLNFRSTKIFQLLNLILTAGIITIIIYSYIPIRASMNPVVGFGKPQSFIEVINHITAKIYRPFFFLSIETFFENLKFFFSSLLFHFNIYDFNNSEFNLNILFVIFGIIYCINFFRKIFYFFFGFLLLYILIPSFYGVLDIDAFFIQAIFAIAIFIFIGIYSMIKMIKRNYVKNIFIGSLILMLIIQFYVNFKRVDQKNNYLLEDYFNSIVKNIEPNSIVLNSSAWLHSMSLYFQLVENVKPSIVFITYPFAKEKWYAEQVNRFFAKEELIKLSDDNLQINLQNRPIYLTYEMMKATASGELKFSDQYTLIPFGITFKVVKKGHYVEQPFDLYNLRFNQMNFLTVQDLKRIVIEMMVKRIYYEVEFHKIEKAKELTRLFIEKFGIEYLPIELLKLL